MAKIPKAPGNFSEETLLAFAKDLKSGRIPLVRQTLSDHMVTGLRAIVNQSGSVSYHVSYSMTPDNRPFMRLGSANRESPDYITIEEARDLARTVKHLAGLGVDPQDGLTRRLIAELQRDGTSWRPPKIETKRRASK